MPPLFSWNLSGAGSWCAESLQIPYSCFNKGHLMQERHLLLEQLSGFHCSILLILADFMFISTFFCFIFLQNISETLFETGYNIAPILKLTFSSSPNSPHCFPKNFTNFFPLSFSALFGLFAVSCHILSRQTALTSWHKGSLLLFGISYIWWLEKNC